MTDDDSAEDVDHADDADPADPADDVDHADHTDHAESGETRQTSPMQAYDTREVGLGAAILAGGLVLTFGLAVALV